MTGAAARHHVIARLRHREPEGRAQGSQGGQPDRKLGRGAPMSSRGSGATEGPSVPDRKEDGRTGAQTHGHSLSTSLVSYRGYGRRSALPPRRLALEGPSSRGGDIGSRRAADRR